jgi:hypothetical protein
VPRKITPTSTFDEMEDEVLFTLAALKADPDAAPLAPMADGWLDMLDHARAKDRAARKAQCEADATRIVANGRLDRACEKFGDDLYLAVDKDRSSPRWLQFFNVSVSRFVRQRLETQVQRVRGWLTTKDTLFADHRDGLDRWSQAAGDAIIQTRAVALVRGEARIAREELAEDLTRERDGLHDALSVQGRSLGLAREWPDLFFRIQSRAGADDTQATPANPASPPVEG